MVYINKSINVGPQFYNAYLIKAETLIELGNRPAAIALLEGVRTDLEQRVKDGKLPAGLEPESKVYLQRIKKMLRS